MKDNVFRTNNKEFEERRRREVSCVGDSHQSVSGEESYSVFNDDIKFREQELVKGTQRLNRLSLGPRSGRPGVNGIALVSAC